MQMASEEAARRVELLMEANGDDVEVVSVQPKGRDVWIAEVYRPATTDREQGIFTTEQLLAAE